MASEREEIYELLGVAPGRLAIAGVQITAWGRDLILECTYGEGEDGAAGRQPFQLLLEGCQSIQWDALGYADEQDAEALVVGMFLGEEGHGAAAIIATDVFELSVLYGTLTLVKEW